MSYELDEYAAKPIAYFSHDAKAHDDEKLKRLKLRKGLEAIARWWFLCEHLAAADNHYLRCQSQEDWEIIAMYLDFDTIDEAQAYIDTLRSLQLIAQDTEFIWSERMNRNAEKVAVKRRNGAKGGRPKGKNL